MKVLFKYISIQFAKYFFVVVVVLSLLLIISDIFSKLWGFLKAGEGARFLSYILNSIPHHIYFLIPFAVLISGVLFASILSNSGEMTAILTSGVSYVKLYLLFTPQLCLVSILTILLQEAVMPSTKAPTSQIETLLHDVFIPQEGVVAKTLDINKKIAYRVYNINTSSYHETAIVNTLPVAETKKYVSTIELLKKINERRNLMMNTRELEVEFAKRTAYPFSVFIVTFLALPFGIGHHRFYKTRASGIGLLLGFFYFGTSEVLRAFGMKEWFPVLISGWGTNIIFAILAYINHINRRI